MVILQQAAQYQKDPYKVNISDEALQKIIQSALTGEDSSDEDINQKP